MILMNRVRDSADPGLGGLYETHGQIRLLESEYPVEFQPRSSARNRPKWTAPLPDRMFLRQSLLPPDQGGRCIHLLAHFRIALWHEAFREREKVARCVAWIVPRAYARVQTLSRLSALCVLA